MSHRVTDRHPGGILRWWWIIVLLTAVGGVAGYMATDLIEPVYRADASILVGRPLLDPTVSRDDIETSAELASTYADVAVRQPVLEATVQALGLDLSWQQLGDQVAANVSRQQSQVVVVAVDAASPQEATSIAAEWVDQIVAISPTGGPGPPPPGSARRFIGDRLRSIEERIAQLDRQNTTLRKQLRSAGPLAVRIRIRIGANDALILDLQKTYSSLLGFIEGTRVSNHLEVLEEPTASPDPVWPKLPLNVAVGAAVGFLLGIAIAHLLTHRRATIVLDRPVLLPDAKPTEADRDANEAAASLRPDYAAGESAERFFFHSDVPAP